jgi:hypothetical protein
MRSVAFVALLSLVHPAVVMAQEAAELPSCERAIADYVEDRTSGPEPQSDLGPGEYGAVLNSGTFLNTCGVPDSTKVVICVAVQNGKAVGATVTSDPKHEEIERCIKGEVAALAYPSHPKMDIARTTFAPADQDEPRASGRSEALGRTPANPPRPVEPKKSGCGCALPGLASEPAPGLAAVVAGVLVFLRRRRR